MTQNGHRMDGTSRRDFMKRGGAAGLTLLWGGCLSTGSAKGPIGANDDIRLGVVGLGGKGTGALSDLLKTRGVRVVALCDADQAFVDKGRGMAEKAGLRPACYTDYRKLLDAGGVDGVVISTCNHQHSLQTIWACEAGVDVYVEKPVSHNYFEGLQAARAAKKYERIVQSGTQNRSDDGLIPAFDFIRSGGIGRILRVRGLCYRVRGSIGKVSGPQPIPSTLDYDLWCGPAPKGPLMREKLHYDWHWVWDTGNGDIGNQGPHELDLIRWVLGEKALPRRVLSLGGRFAWRDDGQTANAQVAYFDFATAPVIFEVRNLPMKKGMKDPDHVRGIRVGVVVECEGGYFAGGRGGGWIYDPNGKRVRQFPGDSGGAHMQNFLDAMRSRRADDLRAPILEGHLSSALAHMANTSLRVGAARRPEEIREQIKADAAALDTYERMLAHLAANEVDLAKEPLTMGAWLEWDHAAERFVKGTDVDRANAMLTRDYRAPFVVKEIKA